ncbi:MAG: hypothetical protein ABFE01_27860 [Phycisphaerales bacterium]
MEVPFGDHLACRALPDQMGIVVSDIENPNTATPGSKGLVCLQLSGGLADSAAAAVRHAAGLDIPIARNARGRSIVQSEQSADKLIAGHLPGRIGEEDAAGTGTDQSANSLAALYCTMRIAGGDDTRVLAGETADVIVAARDFACGI